MPNAIKRFLLVGLLVGATFGATGPAAAEVKMCANTYGGDVVSATNMKCSKARDLVRTWAVRYRRDGVVNRRVLGFRCRGRNDSVEGLTVKCRRGDKNVRFYANVPR
jgi:hypothetical protein